MQAERLEGVKLTEASGPELPSSRQGLMSLTIVACSSDIQMTWQNNPFFSTEQINKWSFYRPHAITKLHKLPFIFARKLCVLMVEITITELGHLLYFGQRLQENGSWYSDVLGRPTL